MSSDNLLLLSDSYKVSHWKFYPPNTQHIYSYFESRGGLWDSTVFFGLQYLIKKYLEGSVLKYRDIIEAEEVFANHFMSGDVFNKKGWIRLWEKHKGKLPIRIKAVPEGSVIPNRNILISVENTDKEFPWLTNYIETLLVQLWYPCTVATQSREIKKILYEYLEKTGTLDGIDFMMHDFGCRGVSSMETASIGGASHLVNFKGTDTIPALEFTRKYYLDVISGYSVPATEHSIMCAWGKNKEEEACQNVLTACPTGIVSVVSDSYDIFNCCKNIWGKQLKNDILNRDGTVVVRPDSGPLPETVLKVLDVLGKQFTISINDKGYKELPSQIRVIQGDGVSIYTITDILSAMEERKWSANNIVFGSGGALLQKLNRDTLKFAFKCSAACINHRWIDVYKDPVTDSGKKSKKGRLCLVKQNNTYSTMSSKLSHDPMDCLHTIFEDGRLLKEWTFQAIKDRAKL